MSVRAAGISIASAGLLALGVWFLAIRDSDSQEPKKITESSRAIERKYDDRRLRSDINAAEARIRALERRIYELETRRVPKAEDSETAPSSNEERSRTKAEKEISKQERIAKIDTGFAAEEVESLWASRTENDLAVAFDKGNFDGSSIENLECRSTFCRMIVKHDSEVRHHAFEGIADLVQMGGVLIPIESDGEPTTVAYLIRKGYDKPQHPARQIRQR